MSDDDYPVSLSDIKNEINIEKPVGEFFNIDLDITSDITELYSAVSHKLPWSSFDLNNNGPNGVYFCVNKWYSPSAPLPAGKSISVDSKQRGAIKKLYLKCDAGETAHISLFVMR